MRHGVLAAIRVLRGAQEGVALVEFAIILPLIVLLVVGLIEVGRFTSLSIRLSNAAHAGATYGIARPDGQNAIQPAAIAAAACSDSGFTCLTSTPSPGKTPSPDTMYISSSMTCTYSVGLPNAACPAPSPGVQRNMYVTVSTSGTFNTMLHYPYIANNVPMSASATMQVGQ